MKYKRLAAMHHISNQTKTLCANKICVQETMDKKEHEVALAQQHTGETSVCSMAQMPVREHLSKF